MARIRTIKPEFFTSEDIVSLSPLARLLYISTWCEADKEGRLQWKPSTFKLRYFPADNCDIQALCAELVSVGLVVLYGNGLAHIPGFAKHQHVNPRESKSALPEPPTHVERMPSHIPADVRALVMERDGGKCVRCGSTDHPQLDHILPQSCLGPHIAENLRVLCRSCNAGRPVSGPGLVADLKRDGHTLESLRVRFGIDASIPELTGREEGNGREGNVKNPPPPSVEGGAFARFWEAWPSNARKVARQQCADKWAKRGCDGIADRVLESVAAHKASAEWQKDGGAFIPAPLVWLNQSRWEAPVGRAANDAAAAEQTAAELAEFRARPATKPPAAIKALLQELPR